MNQFRASIKDVALAAGVSVGTASNVLNDSRTVSAKNRERVLAAVERLGYVRSESARQLRAGHSRIIALLVLDMGNPFCVDIARGAERAARQSGLGVMVCNSAQDPGEEAEYLSLFAEQRVRGLLITPADATGGTLESFRRHRIPFVLVDRQAAGAEECSVSVDDVAGGTLAVRHLVASGHRRIAYVSGPPELSQVRDRRDGALAALAEAGLPGHVLDPRATAHPPQPLRCLNEFTPVTSHRSPSLGRERSRYSSISAGGGRCPSPPEDITIQVLRRLRLEPRTTSSGCSSTCWCRCRSACPPVSSSSSRVASAPSVAVGWRTEVSGTAAAAANSMSS